MCGRTVNTLAPAEIRNLPKVSKVGPKFDSYKPSYNVCPMTWQPVITKDFEQGKDSTLRALQLMRWGGMMSGVPYATINARSESMMTNNLWKGLFKKRRCVVVATGYFEWKTTGTKKQPHFLHRSDGQPIYFAGLYHSRMESDSKKPKTEQKTQKVEIKEEESEDYNESEETNEGESRNTGPTEPCGRYCLITTEASQELGWLHDRMPVILDTEEKVDLWLNTEEYNEKELLSLLVPTTGLECYEVPPLVNSIKNQGKDCIAKLSEYKKTVGIASFFVKKDDARKKRTYDEYESEKYTDNKNKKTIIKPKDVTFLFYLPLVFSTIGAHIKLSPLIFLLNNIKKDKFKKKKKKKKKKSTLR
eukprot:TRINITY_DN10428_c0_g1_i1.p1 TRINITY_DN10428_c0_g1~~TRINITY_DN10428_c0_g1_i1.p1  ORF type:complete len:360 (-),score=76.13 TRINITY_DN10428_c0_g1_i1:12-1091(-)